MENQPGKEKLLEFIGRMNHTTTDAIAAAWVREHPESLPTLRMFCFSENAQYAQRGTRILRLLVNDYPEEIKTWVPEIVAKFMTLPHSGAQREIMRYLAENLKTYPEEYHGELAEIAIETLNDPAQAIAVRVHAMTVSERMCKIYPELADEVISILKAHIPEGSAGFKNRGAKVIARLQRIRPA